MDLTGIRAKKLGRTYQSVFAKWNNMQKEKHGLEQPSSQKVKDAVPDSADEDDLKKLHSPKKKKRKRSKLQDDSLTDEQPSSSNSRLNDHVPTASRGVKQLSNSGAPNSGSETVKSKTRSSHKTTITDDRHREATADSGNTIKSTSKKKRRCEADSVPKITRISGLEQPSSQNVKDSVPESADEDDLKKLHSPKKKKRKRSKLQDDSLTDEQPSSSNSKLNDHVPNASLGVKQFSNAGAPNSGSETVKSKTRSSHKTTITDDRHREATRDSGNTIKSTSKKKRRCEADSVPKITRISGLEQPSSQNVKDSVPESADEDDLKKLYSPKKKKRKRSKLQDGSLTDEQPSSSNSKLNDHVPNASLGVKQFSNAGAPNSGSETVKSKTRSSHKTTITDDRHREATTDSGNTIKSTSKKKRSFKANGVPKITRISGLEQPSSQNVKDAVPESADEDDLKKLHSPKKKKRKRSKLQDDSLTDEQPSSSNSKLNDHVPNASQGVKQFSNAGAPNSGSETVISKTRSSHKTTITDDRHREATTDSGNTIKSTSKKKRRCEADSVPKITRISGDICEELHGCNKVGWQLSKRMKETLKERGTPVRTGTWLPEEDQFLRENIARFHEANPSVDVQELLFGDDTGDVKKRLSLIKETEFYKKMCVGLMRTNYDCYRRVRQVLYANYKVAGAFSADDEKRLRVLYNRYGSNWHKIAKKLGRTYQSVFAKWNNMQKENHGEWSSSENNNLIEGVQSYIHVQDKKGDANKAQDRMPWTELCNSVPGRSAKQCRQHWMLQLRTEFLTGTFAEMWKKKDRCALIEEIIEQNVENESDIDFDQICRNFEGRGRIVSNYFVRRRWRVMKQSVNGYYVQSFPDILDKLAEEFHT